MRKINVENCTWNLLSVLDLSECSFIQFTDNMRAMIPTHQPTKPTHSDNYEVYNLFPLKTTDSLEELEELLQTDKNLCARVVCIL